MNGVFGLQRAACCVSQDLIEVSNTRGRETLLYSPRRNVQDLALFLARLLAKGSGLDRNPKHAYVASMEYGDNAAPCSAVFPVRPEH